MSTGVKLTEEAKKRLKALAKLKERSPHWLMKKAIAEYLDREEDFERQKREDMKRWQHYQKTGKGVKNDEVMKWVSSWGTPKEKAWPKASK